MALPAIAHDDRLGVGGRRREGPEVHAGVDEPEDEEEAADGAEHDAHDGAGRRAAVDRAVGRGDDVGVALAREEGGEEMGSAAGYRGRFNG